jgi:hypothetical protein
VQGGAEARQLAGHVRAREATKVGMERIAAGIQVLVEGVNGVLVEGALAELLAVGASQDHSPGARRGLFPGDRVDQLGWAAVTDVKVRAVLDGGFAAEEDYLDRLAARQLNAPDVVGVVFLVQVHRRFLAHIGSLPRSLNSPE